MLDVLAITAPIYLAIALGWLVTRMGLFERSDMRVMGKFVLYVALPALLFDAVSRKPPGDFLHWNYLLVYALGGLATIGAAVAWQRLRGQPALDGAVQAMGMSCPNSGFIGYPVNLMVLGPIAGVMLGMNMLVENLLLIPLLLALMESATQTAGSWRSVWRNALRGLVRNPLVLALAAGLLVALLGLPVPQTVQRTTGLFAQASSALSLFVIGGSLAGLQIKGMRAQMWHIALGKLVLHPALTWLALVALEFAGMPPLSTALRTGVVLATACPMFSIYPILVQKHGREGVAAAALLGTTLASFFTISFALWLLQH